MFNTLHKRLLAWLIIPLLFMSLAHLVTSYIDNRKNSQLIFDKLLVTLAISISEHALSSGGDILTEDVLDMIHNTTNDNLYYKVIGPGSAFISGYENIPEPPGGINVVERNMQFYDAHYLGQPVRVLAISTLVNNVEYEGWMTTFVAQTLHEREAYVDSFLLNDLYRVIFMILITSILLSVGVNLGLNPLKRLQDSVRNRNPQDLSLIRDNNLPGEIEGLVAELNDLLTRLSAHLVLTKRFVENAAHQLRTPVTALLPQTDLAMRAAKTEREYQAFKKINRSTRHIARLTNQLLSLTYAESISLSEHRFEEIDLSVIAKKGIAQFCELNPSINISAQLQFAPINGIEMFIEEVLKNLLDNALKYAGENAAIIVSTGTFDEQAYIEVIDDGPGIPVEYRSKISERFFRLAKDNNGSGLGLAIVKEVLDTHLATLVIGDPHEHTGCKVTGQFPIAGSTRLVPQNSESNAH